MSEVPQNSDLETFAKFIGLTGSDYDLFYEAYYSLENEDYEEELSQAEEDLIDTYYVK